MIRDAQANRKQAKRTFVRFPSIISNQAARISANEKIVIFLKSTHLCVKCVRNHTISPQNTNIFLKSLQRYFLIKVYILIVNILRLLLALDIVVNNNWTSLLYISIYFLFHSCALFSLHFLFCVSVSFVLWTYVKNWFSFIFNASKFCSINKKHYLCSVKREEH